MTPELISLDNDINTMLTAFRVRSSKGNIIKDISVQFIIKQFGLVISASDASNKDLIVNMISQNYDDWRVVYITTDDNIATKRDEVLWDLMRGGYMRWVRYEFPNQFKSLINEHNYSSKIINKRLELWGDSPKYSFMVEDNKEAMRVPSTVVFSQDPGFFDYMPEEVTKCEKKTVD
jgi:hypothetical protein